MYVFSQLEVAGVVVAGAVASSEVVWVRASLPPECESDTPPGPLADGGPSCPPQDPPEDPPMNPGPTQISIVFVTAGKNGDSFTSKADENLIRAVSEVSPEELASSVQWEVSVLTERSVGVSTLVPTAATVGTFGEWVVPGQGEGRFLNAYTHSEAEAARSAFAASQTPFPNALRYAIKACVDDGGARSCSGEAIVEQDEMDVIRQEYLDLGRHTVPARDDLRLPVAPGFPISDQGFFTEGEMNQDQDFATYWITPLLLTKLEAMRPLVTEATGIEGLLITEGWRNAVHQRCHRPLGQGQFEFRCILFDSAHQYGAAADIRIFRNLPAGMSPRDYFLEIRRVALREDIDGCWEPERDLTRGGRTLDHAHVEWLQGRCPPDWE